MEITMNNVVLMFSATDEKTPYEQGENRKFVKRSPVWTKPEKVLHVMALL